MNLKCSALFLLNDASVNDPLDICVGFWLPISEASPKRILSCCVADP